MERGFKYLLTTDLPDLVIDYLNASEIVGNFMARCIADESLPANFLDVEKDKSTDNQLAT